MPSARHRAGHTVTAQHTSCVSARRSVLRSSGLSWSRAWWGLWPCVQLVCVEARVPPPPPGDPGPLCLIQAEGRESRAGVVLSNIYQRLSTCRLAVPASTEQTTPFQVASGRTSTCHWMVSGNVWAEGRLLWKSRIGFPDL